MSDLLKQYRIAVVGSPDAGKSTFIKNLLHHAIGKELQPDTLMKEVHWSDGRDPMGNPDTRTIKCAKIMFPFESLSRLKRYKNRKDKWMVEYCMYDCPGHLEYIDLIEQGINAANVVIFITNGYNSETTKESTEYKKKISQLLNGKTVINVTSHAPYCSAVRCSEPDSYCFRSKICYNVEDKDACDFFRDFIYCLDYELDQYHYPHDIEEEAINLIIQNVNPSNSNIMFFSGGKDSVVGLKLFEMAGLINDVDVFVPWSGFDFKEVKDWETLWETYFGIDFGKFENHNNLTYETASEYEMMQAKAAANELLIKNLKPDLVSIQYRASDEGVRSKDYHISPRDGYVRFSPVFYFSESNIWRFISKYNIPVNPLYFKGYRSLGDEPVTEPCMPICTTVEEIIEYVENNPSTTERDGRKKQDKSTPFAMEKLRNVGFF